MTRPINTTSTVAFLGRWLVLGAVPALLVAWLLGFMLGARNDLLIWLYYIPAPAAALLGFGWCWVIQRRAPRWLYATTLALTLLAGGKTLLDDFRWNGARLAKADALRVVHWNVAYAKFGRDGVLQRLATHQPDLVFLSELPLRPLVFQ